jgi:hypothetical protein
MVYIKPGTRRIVFPQELVIPIRNFTWAINHEPYSEVEPRPHKVSDLAVQVSTPKSQYTGTLLC